jgi:hypothetical protein
MTSLSPGWNFSGWRSICLRGRATRRLSQASILKWGEARAMPITIYGIKNCDTMKKARAWLDTHGVAYAFHDY